MSMSRITHIVVHYSATYPDQNTTIADIDRMHRARGFNGPGYHWFYRRNGMEEQGRPESVVGAHVGGQNSGKLGLCWEGGIERASGPNVGVNNMTAEQEKALIARIRAIKKRHPNAEVVGHLDLAPTQCPAFDVPAWWARVAGEKAPPATPVPPDAPAVTPGVGEDTTYVVERGDTLWSISRAYGLTVDQLRAFNPGIDETRLEVGDVIRLRSEGSPARMIISEIRARLDELEVTL